MENDADTQRIDTIREQRPSRSGDPQHSTTEQRIAAVGRQLAGALRAVLNDIPGAPHGPAELARTLSLDKVFTGRLLKAARSRDPMAVAHYVPGPDPLRRWLRCSAKCGVSNEQIRKAEAAIDQFETLIRRDAGDRSALDAIISAWLPEVRQQFEVRRKQAAFKAMSQIKGTCAELDTCTQILSPSADGVHLDLASVYGLFGLHRLRPGVAVKASSKRMNSESRPKRIDPQTLTGQPVENIDDLLLKDFCSQPLPELDVHTYDEAVYYTLRGDAYGPNSTIDVVVGEMNHRDLDRYAQAGSNRKAWVFANVSTPVKQLLFDVFVHVDAYPDSEPTLHIYDTAIDGLARANDPSRDIDRFDMLETVQSLGRGISRFRAADVPSYFDIMGDVFQKLRWDSEQFRGYRCRIDYPIYGSQVMMTFERPLKPTP